MGILLLTLDCGKVGSCPQAITEVEAKARVRDTSLPGNVVELKTSFKGEHQEMPKTRGAITYNNILLQFQVRAL